MNMVEIDRLEVWLDVIVKEAEKLQEQSKDEKAKQGVVRIKHITWLIRVFLKERNLVTLNMDWISSDDERHQLYNEARASFQKHCFGNIEKLKKELDKRSKSERKALSSKLYWTITYLIKKFNRRDFAPCLGIQLFDYRAFADKHAEFFFDHLTRELSSTYDPKSENF